MNDFPLTPLKVLVERAVRPVRASLCNKRRMREELLAHVAAVFEEEVARLGDEQAALERTAQRFGNPTELTGQLQESVPARDSVQHFFERCADWVFCRSRESTLRRALRYTLLVEAIALVFLSIMMLLVRGVVGEVPTAVVWQTSPVLLICACLGFTLGLLESAMRRLLEDPTRHSWLLLALVLVGSTVVSMTLGFWTFGVSPKNALWVPCFSVGLPAGLAWGLTRDFAAWKRSHEEWTSLQIE